MGENSEIAWTDHTFNPWIGCTKISPGCANCYAAVDTFARRSRANGLELWGPKAARHVTSDANWKKPLAWDRAAAKAGVRARVFCASLADVFEDRPDLQAPRARLFRLVAATPHLDWLLLTKRPEHADRLWHRAHVEAVAGVPPLAGDVAWLPNIWLGTTCENQEQADERIPHLLATPAAVRFLSCEPLLGPVRIPWRWCVACGVEPARDAETHLHCHDDGMVRRLDWVIVGSESGPGARPMAIGWAESLRDQCSAAGVTFFTKQIATPEGRARGDAKGGDPQWWPGGPSAWPREMPEVSR